MRSAVLSGTFGAAAVMLTHFAGGENGTEGGYVEHPVVRLVSLVALGAFVGGALGWLAAATPSKATVPVGLGFLAGTVGFVVGTVVGVNVLGEALIDGNASRLLTSALIGAGIGWSLGACIGLALVGAAPTTKTASWTLRGVGFTALLVGLATAWFEHSLVGPGGLTTRYLASLQVTTVVDAALIGLTLVIAAGRTRANTSQTAIEPPVMRRLGKAGVVLGCLLSTGVFVVALQSKATVATAIQRGANARTADTLAAAAADYLDKNGSYPADLETLLGSGSTVEIGSFVNFAGAVRGGFCVRVGTDIDREYGGPPYYSAVVHPRPPKARSWTASESWIGDSCRSGR